MVLTPFHRLTQQLWPHLADVLQPIRALAPWTCHTLICFTCPRDCLHPLQVSLVFPCVFIPVFPVSLYQFVLYVQVNQLVVPVHLLFSILFLLVLPILTLACFWTLYPPAWPFCLPWPRACLPLCTSCTLNRLYFLPVHDHSLAYPFGLFNIVRLKPSGSRVCIWVSPCASISMLQNFFVPFPRSVPQHNPILALYGQFLQPHGWFLLWHVQSATVLLHLHCLLFGVSGWVSVQHFEISAGVRRAI